MSEDYGQADRDYWNDKYAEASCHKHEDGEMIYDWFYGSWFCLDCEEEDE